MYLMNMHYLLVGGNGIPDETLLAFCKKWREAHVCDQIADKVQKTSGGDFVVRVDSESDPVERAKRIWEELNPGTDFPLRKEQKVALASCNSDLV